MATNYLDRYLSRRSCGNVSFQLASIASIFLASKIEETRPFRTSDFVALSARDPHVEARCLLRAA